MESRPASALPSVKARVAAFAAIIVAGVSGALIGRSIVAVGCHGNCAGSRAAGTIVGALVAALGVAIVVVLVLRALGEWKVISADPGPPMPGGEDFTPD